MEENTIKEFKDLEKMVINWKEDYKQYITPEGPNNYLIDEFVEEVQEYIVPYVRRLVECGYAKESEAFLWFERYQRHIVELKQEIDNADRNK
jgi:hypothetical protein